MRTIAACSLMTLSLLANALPSIAGGVDILACGTKEKSAITPTDQVNCEWKNGLFDATLAQLYVDGWRIAHVAFFDGTREVMYLERPEMVAKQ